MAKPTPFDTNNPLVVVVHKHGNQWDIHAQTSADPAKNHFQTMKDRLEEVTGPGKKLKDDIDLEYVGRKKTGAPDHPPFKTDPNHPPIMMREGETVTFKCEEPFGFTIWCDRDDNVDPNHSAPSNPFGWTGAQFVDPMGSLTATIGRCPVNGSGNPAGPGPKDQGFFKFSATIYVEAQGGQPPEIKRIDPDGYCDR